MLVEQAVRTGYGLHSGSSAKTDAATSPLPRLVLIIDQMEELFVADTSTDASRADREAFITALHAAATAPVGLQKVPGALVVVAVRADFLGRLIDYPSLNGGLLTLEWASRYAGE